MVFTETISQQKMEVFLGFLGEGFSLNPKNQENSVGTSDFQEAHNYTDCNESNPVGVVCVSRGRSQKRRRGSRQVREGERKNNLTVEARRALHG